MLPVVVILPMEEEGPNSEALLLPTNEEVRAMTLAEFQHRVSLLQQNHPLTEYERELVKLHTRSITFKYGVRDNRIKEKERSKAFKRRVEALERRVEALESENYRLKAVNEPLIPNNSTYSESPVPYRQDDDAS